MRTLWRDGIERRPGAQAGGVDTARSLATAIRPWRCAALRAPTPAVAQLQLVDRSARIGVIFTTM
jgi:hypothetical protein